MANALTDFIRKRDFLVCMDSDGCVMDTVRIKHCSVFCPELIRVFGLEAHTDFITTAWEEINLNSITRGISRFESAVLIFDRLKNRGIDVPGSEDIAAWVSTASELSTASLQQEVLRSGSLALRKLQEWNNACISCTPWPMWRWFPPPMKALSPASGRVTALPPMPM